MRHGVPRRSKLQFIFFYVQSFWRKANAKWWLYGLAFCFFLGLLCSGILLRQDAGDFWYRLQSIQQSHWDSQWDNSVWITFLHALFVHGIFFVISFVFGFWAMGQPFTFFLSFCKGLGIGAYVGAYFLQNGLAGMKDLFLILLSGTLSVLAQLLSSRESLRLSNHMCSMLWEKGSHLPFSFSLYLKKHAVFFALILAAAVLDCLLVSVFVRQGL